jgi:hypothetical protein
MNVRHLQRLTAVAALSLATMSAVAACTSAVPVRPVPTPTTSTTGSAGTASPGATSPAPVASGPAKPPPVQVTVAPTIHPPTGTACRGAVVHRLDASDNGPPWKPLCITVGGVLLVTNLGPEGFSANSWDNVECNYEAAVRECRLLHPGTVKFTIVNAHQTRTLTLRIVKASVPHNPSPACLAAGKTLTVDAADGGPAAWPVCVKMGAKLRVVNLGPEGFVVSPTGAVTCSYEAAVRDCRFTGPGTVTLTTTHGDRAPRTQKVVVIR